ncbi:hypothetical protein OBBRIDRAFT_730146 [Obba rivulosa]|uniref:Alpha/beta hydrolase fold-3 domain-containing protein n=1 Tax=Obba rivulosa TaxID=1052685 RepID=A0A8E2ATQ0_9APHY|nr:hypothetical protein OBBRIDRAFT_730146 [Obba rivulosa]
MSQYTHLSEPDPEFAAQLNRLLQSSSADLDIEAVREFFNQDVSKRNEATYGRRLPHASEYQAQNHHLAVDGAEITLRSYTPIRDNEEAADLPLLYWIHGGGWQIGNLETDDYFLRIICVQFQIAVVNVDYRLVPEHKWPVSLNDAYAGLKWAARNASRLSVSLSKGFIVGGMSSGANMAAIIAHRVRDDPFFAERSFTGQILCIPLVVHPDAYPEEWKDELRSLEEHKDAPILSKQGLYKWYEEYGVIPTDSECSPLLYPSHKGLAPAYIQVCGLDPLRDEGFLYERLLRDASVKTKLDFYPGVPHGFHIVWPDIQQAVKYEHDLMAGLAWLLGRGD